MITSDERWKSARQLSNMANVIYIINLAVLILILVIKFDSFKHFTHINRRANHTFISNAYIKSSNGANVRRLPSISSDIIDKVNNNDRIFIIDQFNNPDTINEQIGYWYKIKIKSGNEGFVWNTAVSKDE